MWLFRHQIWLIGYRQDSAASLRYTFFLQLSSDFKTAGAKLGSSKMKPDNTRGLMYQFGDLVDEANLKLCHGKDTINTSRKRK